MSSKLSLLSCVTLLKLSLYFLPRHLSISPIENEFHQQQFSE